MHQSWKTKDGYADNETGPGDQGPIGARAWLRASNMLSSKISLCMSLCKDSANPLRLGWPDGINAWSVSYSQDYRPKAVVMKLGPLSACSTCGSTRAKVARSSISNS